jgi:hypothetical protein
MNSTCGEWAIASHGRLQVQPRAPYLVPCWLPIFQPHNPSLSYLYHLPGVQIHHLPHFTDERKWLVEKILLSGSKDKFFAVPNSLISSSNPFVPIARYICKGKIVGEITDPAEFFDSPASLLNSDQPPEQPEEVQPPHAPEETSKVNFAPSTPDASQPSAPVPSEEQWGPKTSEMPDPTVYPSSAMEDLLDIGDLPDHLWDKAWAML